MKTLETNRAAKGTAGAARTVRMAALAVLMSATLAACGGNDDPAPAPAPVAVTPAPAPTPVPAPTTAVPASATASVAGLLTFLSSLLGTSSNTAEPVLIGDITLPTSETTEPDVTL